MNSEGPIVFIFILIVFGAIIAGCIYDSHKERDESKDYFDTRPATKITTRGTTNYTRKNTDNELTSKSSQKTIYAFRGKQSVHLCPFCDGENELGVKVCNICRRDL